MGRAIEYLERVVSRPWARRANRDAITDGERELEPWINHPSADELRAAREVLGGAALLASRAHPGDVG